jgi:hypothetical protein
MSESRHALRRIRKGERITRGYEENLSAGCILLVGMVGVSPADDGKGAIDHAALATQGGLSAGVTNANVACSSDGSKSSSLGVQAVPAQAGPCVQQDAPSVDCKCGADGHVVKARCTITVNSSTGQKCGGPYCESCYVVCNRK